MSCIKIDPDRLAVFASILSLIAAFLGYILSLQAIKSDSSEEIVILNKRINQLETELEKLITKN